MVLSLTAPNHDFKRCANEIKMDSLPLFIAFWIPFLIPAAPVMGLCWFFGRRRVQWFKWEYSLLVVPYLVWLPLLMIDGGKSLRNATEEPFYLGCGVALACVIRVLVGRESNQKVVALVLFVAVCLLAVGLWAFVPTMPE